MTWFKVDDKSTFHAKVIAAGNHAWGAFVRAGAWCADRGTDGVIPVDVARVIEPSKKVWDKLMAVGLMRANDDGDSLVIHDYCDWNPTAKQVEAKRIARANAGAVGGRNSASAKQTVKQLLEQNPSNAPAKINPDPDPDPDPIEREMCASPVSPARTPEVSKRETRRSKCPSSVDASDDWVSTHGLPSLDSDEGAELAKFLDHHAGKGTLGANWAATWRTWKAGWDKFGTHRSGPAPGRGGVFGDAEDQCRLEQRKLAREAAREIHGDILR